MGRTTDTIEMSRLVMPVAEAAALLGTNPQKLRESIDNGSFPFGVVYKARSGKRIYKISRTKVNEFLGIREEG